MNPRWNQVLEEGNCHRCQHPSPSRIMSMFCTELICMGCSKKEQQHPDYQHAAKAVADAYISAENNFAGVGKPDDL
jgi:hypothetical protein